VLDLRGRSDVCDFFVLATGAVETQVRAICDAVTDGLARQDHRPLHAEGTTAGRWALLDYVDVIVHVFQPQTRQYYLLERLWNDAGRVDIADEFFADPAVRARHPWLVDAPDAPLPPGHP
jgi:ribosome-associated protein